MALPLPMKGKRPTLDLVAFGLGLGFGHADGGDLWAGVGAAGDVADVQGVDVVEFGDGFSTQITPSWLALWASQGAPVTSPMA